MIAIKVRDFDWLIKRKGFLGLGEGGGRIEGGWSFF